MDFGVLGIASDEGFNDNAPLLHRRNGVQHELQPGHVTALSSCYVGISIRRLSRTGKHVPVPSRPDMERTCSKCPNILVYQ